MARKKKLTKQMVDNMIQDIIHKKTLPIVRQYVKNMAMEINNAIEIFYNDYTPTRYQRLWDFKRLYHVEITQTKTGYFVNHHFNSEFLSDEHRSACRKDNHSPQDIKNIIFDLDFMRGWHGGRVNPFGYAGNPVAYTVPSPWEMIVEAQKQIVRSMGL